VNTPPAAGRFDRSRRIGAVVVGILAVIGVIASVFAVWTRTVLFDSSTVAGAVEQSLSQPEVPESIGRYVTDQVFLLVDVDGRVAEVLPEQLAPLRPVLVGGARRVLTDQLAALVATEQVRAVLVRATERSHAAVVRLLEGEGLVDGIQVVDGEVTVNLLPLVGRGLSGAQQLGLMADRQIPTLTPEGDPAQQIAELEREFDRDLPDDFGQLVVYRSAALAEAGVALSTAQRAVVVFKRAVTVIVLITVALLAATVALAPRRRRALLVLAAASTVALLVARLALDRVVERAPTLVLDPGARVALATSVESLAAGLLRLVTILIVLGVLLAVGAFLTGPSPTAVALQSRVRQWRNGPDEEPSNPA
jgi:hypothetical protein